MSHINSNHEIYALADSFFTIDVSVEEVTVFFNMDLKGIRSILEYINTKIETYIIDKQNILNVLPMENYTPITKLVIKNTLSNSYNGMIINYSSSEDVLHMITNDSSLGYFKECLESLRDLLIKDKTEDISLMTEEWGGYGLINEQIVKDTNIICHLRLYGII